MHSLMKAQDAKTVQEWLDARKINADADLVMKILNMPPAMGIEMPGEEVRDIVRAAPEIFHASTTRSLHGLILLLRLDARRDFVRWKVNEKKR